MVVACSSSVATPTTGVPSSTSLPQAVGNTLAAPSFSEVLNQTSSQGKQTDHLVYQAPDRLGGYIQRGSKRTYVYVIGTTQYQSQAVPNATSTKHLTFQSQTSQGANALDPAHGYLPYATQAKHPTRSGNTHSFTLTKNGQTGTFTYAVRGQYISKFTLTVPNGSVNLDISAVGSRHRWPYPPGPTSDSCPSYGFGDCPVGYRFHGGP